MKRLRNSFRLIATTFLLVGCFKDNHVPKISGSTAPGNIAYKSPSGDLEKDDPQDEATSSGDSASPKARGKLTPGQDSENPGQTGNGLVTCAPGQGKTYKGFGDVELTAGRVEQIPELGDRYRIKPYSALTGEFVRVVGSTPKSLTAAASTFPATPPRWYVEPIGSGVTVFTTYRIGFESGLLLAATDADLASAPTDVTAGVVCAKYAEKAWLRPATPSEIDRCKKIAVVDTAAETDPKARWAYTIASILTAADFVSF